MLRGFREVERNIEREDREKRERETFKYFKPESNITIEEALAITRDIWDSMLQKERA